MFIIHFSESCFLLSLHRLRLEKTNGIDICSMKKQMIEGKFNDLQASQHCLKKWHPYAFHSYQEKTKTLGLSCSIEN